MTQKNDGFTIKTTGHFSPMAVPEPQSDQETSKVSSCQIGIGNYTLIDAPENIDDIIHDLMETAHEIEDEQFNRKMAAALGEYLRTLPNKACFSGLQLSYPRNGYVEEEFKPTENYKVVVILRNHIEVNRAWFTVVFYTEAMAPVYCNDVDIVNVGRYVRNLGGRMDLGAGLKDVTVLPSDYYYEGDNVSTVNPFGITPAGHFSPMGIPGNELPF